MPTLAYLGDATTASHPPNPFAAKAKDVVLYRRMSVADIIAADATMASAGYIAQNDIIQAIPVQAGFFATRAIIRIITSCSASVTGELGLAGGGELIGSTPVAMDAAANTAYGTVEGDSYDLGHYFSAADTIDFQVNAANCAVGDFEIWVFGKQLVLGS